jgi:hypothetical protein
MWRGASEHSHFALDAIIGISASGELGLYPPPCGEGRPPKRSEGGRGGGRAVMHEHRFTPRPPPPTPPHKGEGSTPSARYDRGIKDK